MKIQRIKRIYTYTVTLFWAVMILSCEKNSSQVEPGNSIAIITDLHYLSERLHDNGSGFKTVINGGDGKNLFIQEELLSAFIDNLESEKPAAVLITGDLTFNGGKLSHKDLISRLKKIEDLGIDVYVIPGNHDINNPWARKFKKDKALAADTVTPEKFRSLYRKFGYSGALSYDSSSLSYLIEPIPGIQVLMLDTNIYKDNLKRGYSDPNGSLEDDTREWIIGLAIIAEKENKKLFAAMHHSLIEHNSMVSRGYTIQDNESLTTLFSSLNIKVVLTGHIHIQDIIKKETGNGGIFDIATSAFSVFPHKYGLMAFSDKDWVFQTKSIDVGEWAFKNGKSDEDLLDFRQYSEDYFVGFSEKLVIKSLEKSDFRPSEISELSEIAGILNMNFFAGSEDLNAEDMDGEELSRMFQNSESFLFNYLDSIVSDFEPSDNYLVIGTIVLFLSFIDI